MDQIESVEYNGFEISNGHVDHGWKKVVYPKRNRKQKPADQTATNGGKNAANGDNVFRSLEEQAEDRRRRILAAKMAVSDSDEDESRSKRRSNGYGFDDSEDEIAARKEAEEENVKAAEEAKKKKAKAKKEKKPKVSLPEAAAKIDPSNLEAFLIEASESYASQPEIQLMRFADYFGRALSGVSSVLFPWVKMFKESPLSKLIDVPLSHVPEPVYKTSVDWINQRPIEALGSFVLWAFDCILTDLAAHQVGGAKGGKKGAQQHTSSKSQVAIFVALAMVLRRKPDALTNVLPTLRENPKYQGQDKLPVIVWMMAQASLGDLSVGLLSWAHNLLPVAGSKNCNPQSRDLILQLVEKILSNPKARTILVSGAVRKGDRLIPPPSFEILVRLTFPASSARVKATERFAESMADDILQIFSTFDGRFSREKLSENQPSEDGSGGVAALERALNSLDCQISRFVASDQPIWSDPADSAAFLDSIDELVNLSREWSHASSEKPIGACLSRADDMMQQAMFRIEEEFRSLMDHGAESFPVSHRFDESEEDDDVDDGEEDYDDSQIPVAQPLTDYDLIIDALSSATINDLHEITKRMLAAGFGKSCSHVYSGSRREFLEESMSRLGLQKLSIEDVHKMQWQELEDEIDRWIKAANVALRILFPSERRLCDRVFFGFSSAADLSFMEVCRGSTIQLLNFADAIAIGSRSPERLFKVLDVFETMRDLMVEFESVFSDQFCLVLRNEAVTIWKRLGEAVRGIFMELENLIRRDPAKAAVPGGGLHPITRYVMNYLRAACRSRQTLEQVFEESNGVPSKDSTLLTVQMSWIMELLESNLEVKSKVYKDPALSYVFLMNNGRYIVQKVRDGELGVLLGEDWIRKHNAKVKQYHMSYQRSSWNKMLGLLKVDNAAAGMNGLGKTMKEKLKEFNMQFDEVCKAHSTWVVFDEQMREELRISLARLLLPAYGNFIARFQNLGDIGKNADRYIKYGVEDIEARVNELFKGTTTARK